jgi:hypothetical protein
MQRQYEVEDSRLHSPSLEFSMVFALRVALLVFSIGCGAFSFADEPKEVAPEDPDVFVQGEYLGEITKLDGKQKLGVQVIALGDHKFHAVGYDGGLPGAGWDKSDTHEANGETAEGVTTFKDGQFTAKIRGGVLVITAEGGVNVAELQKVARQSPTRDAKAPEGAVVLFDGTNTDQWENGKMTDDGLLTQGVASRQKFQSGTLHLEFMLPFEPKGRGQNRGNSGCYLQGRYEVQILDSFGLKGASNECGAIYSVKAPDVNMCYPPLVWQTYDIEFTAAEFKDGKKTRNARLTVRQNGVVIQDNVEVDHATTAAPKPEGPEPGPIYLQDHGHPVRFRNVWFVEKK